MSNRPSLPIHALYEAAVQNVDTDLDFGVRVYKSYHKKNPQRIREDFCGTAKLSSHWVQRNQQNQAWGIDFHAPTLRWAKQSIDLLSTEEQERIDLLCDDVLSAKTPSVDLCFALNFSFCIFKERAQLRRYFQQVYRHLRPGGMLILDLYGGTESVIEKRDDIREIPGFSTSQGLQIPDFEYIWDQVSYNPITHHTQCEIHFNVPGWKPITAAFRYDWRLWTLPEISEILAEAGFSSSAVYLHDFDEDGESDEIFRRRKNYQNVEGWVAYVVGIRN
jgi:SAM-dependent methyltransferase